jgi:hypothetical protein
MGPKGRRAFRSLAAMCSLGCFLCDLCAFAVRLTPRPPAREPKPWGRGMSRFETIVDAYAAFHPMTCAV